MKAVVFAVPGDLATPTGGYVYARRIIAELKALGWQVDVLDLGNGFPRPTQRTRADANANLAALPNHRPIVIDGLAYGALPEAAEQLHKSLMLFALVHHPLALETGLSAEESAALRRNERAALAHAKRVIATSPTTASVLAADYGVPFARLKVVRPGTDRAPSRRRNHDSPVSILSVGSVVPRKGYDVLIAALARLAQLPWRLVIAGDRSRDPQAAARLDADIARFSLGERVQLLGAIEPEKLSELYASADLFVLASRYEGYGMAFTEAIANGLPVVGTRAGAIPETVPPGVGVLVPVDDVDALAAALRGLIERPAQREQLAVVARAAATIFPTWRDSGALFAQALEGAE